MKAKGYSIFIIVFLVLTNSLLVFKVYDQRMELEYVYKNSDFLKKKDAKLVFDTYSYDFGVLELDKDYEYDFSFTNIYNKKMKIRNVITSCGCTASTWSRASILPGEKGVIKLNYHARPVGEFTKYIAIVIDGESKPVQLEIKGVVIAHK